MVRLVPTFPQSVTVPSVTQPAVPPHEAGSSSVQLMRQTFRLVASPPVELFAWKHLPAPVMPQSLPTASQYAWHVPPSLHVRPTAQSLVAAHGVPIFPAPAFTHAVRPVVDVTSQVWFAAQPHCGARPHTVAPGGGTHPASGGPVSAITLASGAGPASARASATASRAPASTTGSESSTRPPVAHATAAAAMRLTSPRVPRFIRPPLARALLRARDGGHRTPLTTLSP